MDKIKFDILKNVIKDNIEDADCGIFFSRNIVGDTMTTIYEDDDFTVDICYGYAYFEVFGLTGNEILELEKYYNELQKEYRGR